MNTVRDRMMEKFTLSERGCWLWTGYVMPNGYGKIMVVLPGGRIASRLVHRMAYELHVGPIPEGADVGHTCHDEDLGCPGGPTCEHRRCLNPRHLQAMTRRENLRAGRKPGGNHGRANALKTHCRCGLPYDEQNTMVTKNGSRACKACRSRYNREWRQRRKAA